MAVAAQAARGPPRLLCMLVLGVLAMASFYCIFMLLGMQHFETSTRSIISNNEYQTPSSTTVTQILHEVLDAAAPAQKKHHGKEWSPVTSLRHLLPYADPLDASYHAPVIPSSGFLYSTIIGELHEIHTAVSDLVVIARLLNATIVLPKIQIIASVIGGGGGKVKRFSYLYDEQHFVAALKDDVQVVKLLPEELRTRTRLQKQSVKTLMRDSSVQYYLDEVLPALAAHGACGLVFQDGGGLQSLLSPQLAELQRLRCRVAFHALRFKKEIHDLGVQLVKRLEARGPYVVVQLGLERDVLAFHGCAELFQDLQTESIQMQRAHLLASGVEVGYLSIDSHGQRRDGNCPLIPMEVGLLLETYGFHEDTRIYLAGTENTGGQRLLLHLRSMYPNLEDRSTLSTLQERSKILETPSKKSKNSILARFSNTFKKFLSWWKNEPSADDANQKGWWRMVGECEARTEDHFISATLEGERKDIQLLHAALDYMVSVEANTYFPAFDRDRHGLPSVASLVTGHRLYQSASLKTYRLNRSALVIHLDQYPYDHPQELTIWEGPVRRLLMESLNPGASSLKVKSELFLSHPMPECVCQIGASANSDERLDVTEGVTVCPARYRIDRRY